MIDTDSSFFRYGLIAVIVVAFMLAVVDSREVVPVVAEKTYLTKTVPHEDTVKWNWLKVTTETSKFYMGGREGRIIQIPDNSVDWSNFHVQSDPPGVVTVTGKE